MDYRNGGTAFEIDGEVVNLEGVTDIGDICIWRFDYPHWVTQSDLKDQFDWGSEKGRWVATFPYNDPFLRV
jgi:plasmid replication initiation protein